MVRAAERRRRGHPARRQNHKRALRSPKRWVDKTPHRNRPAGERLQSGGGRENAKPPPTRKQTMEWMEAYFDKFGQVHVIEM